MDRRQFATVAVAVLLTFVSASAVFAFQNPTQAPPDGNTPGVIWNSTTAQTASFNITGTGKITGGAAFGSYDPDPTYGVTTPNLYAETVCLGAPADCRSAWPAGGGGGGGISQDEADGRYVNDTGDTMTGDLIVQGDVMPTRLCLSGVCNASWPAGDGSGDITSVTAGDGLAGGGPTGDVTLSLDAGHDSGSAFDTRFVNVSGDTMTGALNLTALTATGDVQGNRMCLGADCRSVWPEAGGDGTITSVAAGKGMVGGGASGDVTLDVAGGTGLTVSDDGIALNTGYTDAEYVNTTGDKMTGDLTIAGSNLTVGGGGAFGNYAIDPGNAVTTPSAFVQNLSGGLAAFGGYAIDPQFPVTSPNIWGDAIFANDLTAYDDVNFPGTVNINVLYTSPNGGPAAGKELTAGDTYAVSVSTPDLEATNASLTLIGAGGLVPTAGIGVNTIGSTYGIYAETTGVGSPYAGYFVGDLYVTGGIKARNGTKVVADIAESVRVDGGADAGDVMVATGEASGGAPRFIRASRTRDPRVAGVISEAPALTLGEGKDRKPLAVSGIVRVNAVGPVATGDLLVSSDLSGHAMRCGDASGCPGTVVGKALQDLKTGRDIILMMVMLR